MVEITEIKSIFWGLTLENEKRYSQTVKTDFHISMASLELPQGKQKEGHIGVMIQQGDSEYLLCTLSYGVLQQQLDLNFKENEEVTFFLTGKGRVHLTGYIVGNDGLDSDDDDDVSWDSNVEVQSVSEDDSDAEDSSEDSDDDEAPKLVALESSVKKGASGDASKSKKNPKQQLMMDEADSDSDDDDDDSDVLITDLTALLAGSSDDDDDDESADFESGDDTEGSFLAKTTKKQVASPGENLKEKSKKRKLENGKETPAKKKKKPDGKASASPNTPKAEVSMDTTTTPESSEKKKKKKKKKKNKNKDNAATPGQESGKSPSQPGSESKGKSPGDSAKKGGGDGKKQTPKQTPKAKKQVLQGGVIAEDLKEGHGPAATPGKMVGVYYQGRLASNNKQFDSTLSGTPFKFRLGKKEVISGWDIGLKGMKVGGKRRLTIPANMAYGNQRQGPIPANSALNFEVELKTIS